jgi:hypothetical protein
MLVSLVPHQLVTLLNGEEEQVVGVSVMGELQFMVLEEEEEEVPALAETRVLK